MRVLYNIANRGECVIGSKEPCVRIEGFVPEGVTNDKGGQLMGKLSYDEPFWHTVGISDASAQAHAWVSHRESVSKELMEAMALKTIRNRRIVIVERILSLSTDNLKTEATVAAEAVANYVKPIERNDEKRGQSWAIVAIMGDAKHEIDRLKLITEIADSYIEFMKGAIENELCETDDIENQIVSSYFQRDDLDDLDRAFAHIVSEKLWALKNIPNEPIIAFYGFSDDPEALVEKSAKLSNNAFLKHADIAVVAMYSWLFLESWKKAKGIKRTSRDPKAESFFKTMRDAQT